MRGSCYAFHINSTGPKKLKDWRQLAQAAADEQDPQKLLALTAELNAALEQHLNQLRGPVPAEPIAKRLLFVDDEPSIRLTLPPLLDEHGFQVRVAQRARGRCRDREP